MGLSIYKSDIDTISDNINIINYKQKNIDNVINTINDSVNTLKANCYGTTVSVMCFKLNNLKQQIESINEYLTKYKQESQQVVDLYYQHCEGLNLDEDTLRNNISILNNKIDRYNNLSKPNKRLVNNATLQLERNQELLDGLYYVNDNTYGLMQISSTTQRSNKKDGWDIFSEIWNFGLIQFIFSGIIPGNLAFYGLYEYIITNERTGFRTKDLFRGFGHFKTTNFAGKLLKGLGWISIGITTIDSLKKDIYELDYSDPASYVKTTAHIGVDLGLGYLCADGCMELGMVIGSAICPGLGTVIGGGIGVLAGGFVAWGLSELGVNDGLKDASDAIVDGVFGFFKPILGIGNPLW